jgi:hypothetical protein
MSLSFESWKQIEALYLEAVNEPPAKQAELFAKSDPEVRAVVARMLNQEVQRSSISRRGRLRRKRWK